jgi:ligand-binding SRPBCC domain-containing protein
MVHVKDDGVFDAPLEKIWRFLQSNEKHEHKAIKSSKVLEQKGANMTIETEMMNPDGTTRMETWQMTFNPPQGFTIEVVSGRMKGTKHTHTYTPMGNKTRVEVEGEFHAQGMDDNAIRKAALAMLAEVFDEDNASLKSFK